MYTRKDIIIDPKDPRLVNSIGKTVYASDNLENILIIARQDLWSVTLVGINEDADLCPFITHCKEFRSDTHYAAIILKKEE